MVRRPLNQAKMGDIVEIEAIQTDILTRRKLKKLGLFKSKRLEVISGKNRSDLTVKASEKSITIKWNLVKKICIFR